MFLTLFLTLIHRDIYNDTFKIWCIMMSYIMGYMYYHLGRKHTNHNVNNFQEKVASLVVVVSLKPSRLAGTLVVLGSVYNDCMMTSCVGLPEPNMITGNPLNVTLSLSFCYPVRNHSLWIKWKPYSACKGLVHPITKKRDISPDGLVISWGLCNPAATLNEWWIKFCSSCSKHWKWLRQWPGYSGKSPGRHC